MAELISLSKALQNGAILKNNTLRATQKRIGYIDLVPNVYQNTVKALYLGGNFIQTVNGLNQFQHLKSLSLANNRLNDVFYVFEYMSEHLPQLESLQISGNPLSRYPNHLMHAIAKLKNLVMINGRRIQDNDVIIAKDFVNKELALIKMLSVNNSMISKLSHIVNKLRLHHEMNSVIPSIQFDVNSLLDIVGDKYETMIGDINELVQPAYLMWCKKYPHLMNLGVSVDLNDLLRTWCDEVLPDLVTEQQRAIAKLIRDVEVLKQDLQQRRIKNATLTHIKQRKLSNNHKRFLTKSSKKRSSRQKPNRIITNNDAETMINLDMMGLASEASVNLQNHVLNSVDISPRNGITISRPQSPISPNRRIKSPTKNQIFSALESPHSHRSKSPVSHRSKSPVSHRSKSPVSHRSKSPVSHRSKSPVSHHSKSPTVQNQSRPHTPAHVRFKSSSLLSPVMVSHLERSSQQIPNSARHFFPNSMAINNRSSSINANTDTNVIVERLVYQLKRFKEQNETNVRMAAKKIGALNLQNVTQQRSYTSRIDSLRTICSSLDRQVLMYRNQASHLQNMKMGDDNTYNVLNAQLKAAHECNSEITQTLSTISKQYQDEIDTIQKDYEKLHYSLLESNDEKHFVAQMLKYRHMYLVYQNEFSKRVDYFQRWIVENPDAIDTIGRLRYQQSLRYVKKCWKHWLIYIKRNRMIKEKRQKRLKNIVIRCFKAWKKYWTIDKISGHKLYEEHRKRFLKHYLWNWQRTLYQVREHRTVVVVCDKFYKKNCLSKFFHKWYGKYKLHESYYNDESSFEKMKDKIKQFRRKYLCSKVLKFWSKYTTKRKNLLLNITQQIYLIRKRNYFRKFLQILQYNDLILLAHDHYCNRMKRQSLLALRYYLQLRRRKKRLLKISERFQLNRYLLRWWRLYKFRLYEMQLYKKSYIFFRYYQLKKYIKKWKELLINNIKMKNIIERHDYNVLKNGFKKWYKVYNDQQINKLRMQTLELQNRLTLKDNECHSLQEESDILTEQLNHYVNELSTIHLKISGMYSNVSNAQQSSIDNRHHPTSPISKSSTLSIELL